VKDLLQGLIGKARAKGVTFGDARYVEKDSMSIRLQDGRTEKLSQSVQKAVGVRVLVEGAWGFASTDRLDGRELERCLDGAVAMAKAAEGKVAEPGVVELVEQTIDQVTASVRRHPREVPVEEKVERLRLFHREAEAAGNGKLSNVLITYVDSYFREMICNTVGTLVDNEQIRVMAGATVTAVERDVRQRGHKHIGGTAGYEMVEETDPEDIGGEATRSAVSLLSARRAPSGRFPVIFHPSITGLFVHEAVGHNAEADLVFSGASIIAGRLGEGVASDLVTIVDDSTVKNLNGSYAYDSEGVPGRKRILVNKGTLKGYLHSLETAARFGAEPTGSGRAEDAHSMPIVRMSNTFIEPGEKSFADMVAEMDEGILLDEGEWGYVMTERGQFTCRAHKGWLIKNGKLAEPIREVSVSGMTLQALNDIDAVSKEFETDMPGTCGKNGQGAPVQGGGPYIRVKELVVGGQE